MIRPLTAEAARAERPSGRTIRELGATSVARIGWYTLPPFARGAPAIPLMGWSSDRLRERRWHVAAGLVPGSLALDPSTRFAGSLWPTIAVLCVAGLFISGGGALFRAIPPTYLSREAAAAGVAVLGSMGILGGVGGGLAFITASICVGGLATLIGVPADAARVGAAPRPGEAAP